MLAEFIALPPAIIVVKGYDNANGVSDVHNDTCSCDQLSLPVS
jgi:hypothetical protein